MAVLSLYLCSPSRNARPGGARQVRRLEDEKHAGQRQPMNDMLPTAPYPTVHTRPPYAVVV